MIPFATAPALLIGIGARIVLDHFSRSNPPAIKDYILLGAWQGVALHYAAKASARSAVAVFVAFLITAKLFIEFAIFPDATRCISTVLGAALGVLFTDFLSQYFDKPTKPPRTPEHERRRKKTPKDDRRRDKVVQWRPSVQGGSVETITEISTSLATGSSSHLFSDITSVDSHSDKLGPISALSPLEREIHVLRTRAALADSERRRFKEERKWAISQGNEARASQMKWEVKRYTTLTETFNREADFKAAFLKSDDEQANSLLLSESLPLSPASGSPTPKNISSKSSRTLVSNGNGSPSATAEHSKPSPRRLSKTREANG